MLNDWLPGLLFGFDELRGLVRGERARIGAERRELLADRSFKEHAAQIAADLLDDLGRKRLFVAELGNNSVGILDLNDRKVVHRITGLKEPQGVAYVPETETLYVANRGDGSVRMFRGADYAPAGRIELHSDGDNVRFSCRR